MRSAPSAGAERAAPELLRAALDAGLTLLFMPGGATCVQVTNKRSSRQRRAFVELRDNPFVWPLMAGFYYPGDWRRVQ